MKNQDLISQLEHCAKMILSEPSDTFNFKAFYNRNIPKRIKGGVFTLKDENYFIKFFYNSLNKEDVRRYYEFSSKFPAPQILTIVKLNKKATAIVFSYINAININGFSQTIQSFKAYEHKIKNFFLKITEKYLEGLDYIDRNAQYPARIFFEDRFLGKQSTVFYQKDFRLLINDISYLHKKLESKITKCIGLINLFFTSSSFTARTLTHGDLHSLNYSYDWFFWDVDQSGINPIVGDLSICFWYLVYQRFLLIQYNPYYIQNNSRNNAQISISDFKKEFEIFFDYMFIPIINKISLSTDWKAEFISMLFCRCFLVNNVLDYSASDRLCIYKLWCDLINWHTNNGTVEELKLLSLKILECLTIK